MWAANNDDQGALSPLLSVFRNVLLGMDRDRAARIISRRMQAYFTTDSDGQLVRNTISTSPIPHRYFIEFDHQPYDARHLMTWIETRAGHLRTVPHSRRLLTDSEVRQIQQRVNPAAFERQRVIQAFLDDGDVRKFSKTINKIAVCMRAWQMAGNETFDNVAIEAESCVVDGFDRSLESFAYRLQVERADFRDSTINMDMRVSTSILTLTYFGGVTFDQLSRRVKRSFPNGELWALYAVPVGWTGVASRFREGLFEPNDAAKGCAEITQIFLN